MNYKWNHDNPYNDLPTYIRTHFKDRIQKISVNAGFTCPNRDGTKGTGGCTYCNNQSFNPEYCDNTSTIKAQLERGIDFFRAKYETQKYLAYFQSYTNTYQPLDQLVKKYNEALSIKGMAGLVIGTRPDCMSIELLEWFNQKQKEGYYITIEYGVESTNETTLKRINRGHTYAESIEAINLTHRYNIPIGVHLILGLPGESYETILKHAVEISKLPVHTLKLHQLQLVRGTAMADEFEAMPQDFKLFEVAEYIDLVIDFIERLSPDIIIERFVSQSPKQLLIAPAWGLKNFEFVRKVVSTMQKRGTYQGRLYQPES